MEYRFSFNTRMLVLSLVALLIALVLSFWLGWALGADSAPVFEASPGVNVHAGKATTN